MRYHTQGRLKNTAVALFKREYFKGNVKQKNKNSSFYNNSISLTYT